MNYIVRDIKISKLEGSELEGNSKKINNFFIKLFDGLEEIKNDSGNIRWDKEGDTYIMQNESEKRMWLDHDIWSIFDKEFNYNSEESNEIINYMLEVFLKRKVYEIHIIYFHMKNTYNIDITKN